MVYNRIRERWKKNLHKTIYQIVLFRLLSSDYLEELKFKRETNVLSYLHEDNAC